MASPYLFIAYFKMRDGKYTLLALFLVLPCFCSLVCVHTLVLLTQLHGKSYYQLTFRLVGLYWLLWREMDTKEIVVCVGNELSKVARELADTQNELLRKLPGELLVKGQLK